MKKNKFARIQTAEELEKALKHIKSEQQRIGVDIEYGLKRKREQLQPANLALSAIRQFSSHTPWADLALGIVRGLKAVLTPKDTKKVSGKKEEIIAPEELPQSEISTRELPEEN